MTTTTQSRSNSRYTKTITKNVFEPWKRKAKGRFEFTYEQGVEVLRLDALRVPLTQISSLLRLPYAAVASALELRSDKHETKLKSN
jgi:hypothetical protein